MSLYNESAHYSVELQNSISEMLMHKIDSIGAEMRQQLGLGSGSFSCPTRGLYYKIYDVAFKLSRYQLMLSIDTFDLYKGV